MIVGRSLRTQVSANRACIQIESHSRCDTRLNNLLCYTVQTSAIGLIVAFVDGEVKVVCAVYLDIEETGTAAR